MSKKTKNNFRKCLITKEVCHKSALQRYVIQDHQIIWDEQGTMLGRGYYFKKEFSPTMCQQALKKKAKLA